MRELLRLPIDKLAVEQRQRLRRNARDGPSLGTLRRIAKVKRFEHRYQQRPLYERIDGPPADLRLWRLLPRRLLVGMCLNRSQWDWQIHRWSIHLAIQISGY